MIHILNSNSTITNIDENCIQPNAVDLRLLSIKSIYNTTFILSEQERVHCKTEPLHADADGNFFLQSCQAYQVEFNHYVEIAEGEAGIVVPRSSLNRNGIFIKSGLYDSGFQNNIGATLYAFNDCKIKVGSRVAQFILVSAESLSKYDGVYNN